MKNNYPILYSYISCPFCMRARFALIYAGIEFYLREIDFSAKPQELIDRSPKGTVPVLVLPDNTVIDQSLDIMFWALENQDPEKWLPVRIEDVADAKEIIHFNDIQFSPTLRKYKTLAMDDLITREAIRGEAVKFIANIEALLTGSEYIQGNTKTIADVALFPFIRLFSLIEQEWFVTCELNNTKLWLERMTKMDIFNKVMHKYPVWNSDLNHEYLVTNAKI